MTKAVQIRDILDDESEDIDTTSDLEDAQTSQLAEFIATSKSKRFTDLFNILIPWPMHFR